MTTDSSSKLAPHPTSVTPPPIVVPPLRPDDQKIQRVTGLVFLALAWLGSLSLIAVRYFTPISTFSYGLSAAFIIPSFIYGVANIPQKKMLPPPTDSPDAFITPQRPIRLPSSLKSTQEALATRLQSSPLPLSTLRAIEQLLDQASRSAPPSPTVPKPTQLRSNILTNLLPKLVSYAEILQQFLTEFSDDLTESASATPTSIIQSLVETCQDSTTLHAMNTWLENQIGRLAIKTLPLHLGLPNPSANCFMNAALQALFSETELGRDLFASLQTIITTPSIAAYNPTQTVEILTTRRIPNAEGKTFVPTQIALTAEELESYLASFKGKEADLFKALREKTPPFKAPSLTAGLENFYVQLTLGEAASTLGKLLHKWLGSTETSPTPLNPDESNMIRLCAMKLLGRKSTLKIDLPPPGTDEPVLFSLSIPGVFASAGNDHGLSILPTHQEDAAEFATSLLQSLQTLVLGEHPFTLGVERTRIAYTPESIETRDPLTLSSNPTELARKGPIPEHLSAITMTLTTPGDGESPFIKLDDPSHLEPFIPRLELTTYMTPYEGIDGVALDTPVVESSTYVLSPPSVLVIHPQMGHSTLHKCEGVRFEFTHPLTWTIALSNPSIPGLTAPLSYTLSSIIVHQGTGVSSGHYVCYVKHDHPTLGEIWIEYNDLFFQCVPRSRIEELLAGIVADVSVNQLTFKKIP